ncbi:hypothetical protein BSNK01_18950 [Bacillaceae bacterium]
MKELAGKPPHAPEVQEMIDQYVKVTLRFVGEDTLSALAAWIMRGRKNGRNGFRRPSPKKRKIG